MTVLRYVHVLPHRSELTKLAGHDSLAGPDCSQWPTRLHADHLASL